MGDDLHMTDPNESRQKPIARRLRFEVFRRDDHSCRYCGGRAPDVELTVDHVVPRALGGSDEPSNLVTACKDCNSGKASIAPDAHLVDQVAADAERFALALQAVAESRRRDRAAMDEHVAWFDVAWLDWTWTDRNGERHHIDRPADWAASVERFFTLGLDRTDLSSFIRATMTTSGVRDQWRYMCAKAWAEINTRQELARATVRPAVAEESTPGYDPGYDAGWHDAEVYGSSLGCESCKRRLGAH